MKSFPVANSARWEPRLAIGLALGMLAYHVWAATVGWKTPDLPGIEFRQTQTAISCYFIKAEHNYSLSYPTPVLGMPWSIPMEFPLYQWSVAGLSERAGLPLAVAGRTVSLGCFYLALPALYLLLGLTRLPAWRRLLVLTMMLTSPLYIFYSRAFLMESMALMFALWYAFGYTRSVETLKWHWFVLACVTGSLAGLVKVTTLLFLLIPLLPWTLSRLWADWRADPGTERPAPWIRRIALAVGAVAVPAAVSLWWMHRADAIKALNANAAFLLSGNLSGFNFGDDHHWDPAIWRRHWEITTAELMPVLLLAGTGIILAWGARRQWAAVWLLLFSFVAVQMVFPTLYAYHDYYYMANGFALLLAAGLVLDRLFDTAAPRGLAWLAILLVQAVQISGYLQGHYLQLKYWQPGGNALTFALREGTNLGDVLIIAGDDWNSMTPYYSERRALMFPNGTEFDLGRRRKAFAALRGEPVTALVLKGGQRSNDGLLRDAVEEFGIDPRPVFASGDATVYLHRLHRLSAISLVTRLPHNLSVQLTKASVEEKDYRIGREVEMAEYLQGQRPDFAERFSLMHPKPWKYFTRFGLNPQGVEGRAFVGAHPETKLWFKVPPMATSIEVECYIAESAYQGLAHPGDATDGVEFVIARPVGPDEKLDYLATRYLDPYAHPSDRGVQVLRYQGTLRAGEDIVVLTLPGQRQNYTRDWASIGRVEIR